MRHDKGFTLLELIIAVAIFSLLTSVVFFAFSQSLSVWERADRAVEDSDDMILLCHWMKDVFHSAENIAIRGANNGPLIFFKGGKDKVYFISSNPLYGMRKLVSFVKIEFRNGALVYAEENFFRAESFFKNSGLPEFAKEFEIMTGVEDGRFAYLALEDEKESWKEEYDAEATTSMPRAVTIAFTRKGKPVEIRVDILLDAAMKYRFNREIF